MSSKRGALAVFFQNQFGDFLNGFQEGALLADVIILTVFLIDFNDRLDAQQRGKQTFQMADSSAGNQVFQVRQGKVRVGCRLYLLEQPQDLLFAPTCFYGARGGFHLPTGARRQGERVNHSHVGIHLFGCHTRRVAGAA